MGFKEVENNYKVVKSNQEWWNQTGSGENSKSGEIKVKMVK